MAEDPFPDPANLIAVPPSPIRPPDDVSVVRIADTEDPLAKLDEEEAEQQRRDTAAKSSALTLEMIGDIPFAAVRPPENILFVCKLNPVTQDEDLELIFSRFGKILSCEIVRDRATGDSLQYAFIEFDEQSSAEQVRPAASRLLRCSSLTCRPTSRCRMCWWMTGGSGSTFRSPSPR